VQFFFMAFAIAARFVCGSLSDRIGRRLLLALSCIIMAVGIAGYSLLPVLFLLLIFRGFQGFGFSTNGQTVSAATADVMPKEKMGLGFGIVWIGQAIAAIAAAKLASAAIAAGNYGVTFFTLTALLTVGAILGYFCDYEKMQEYSSCRPEPAPDRKGIWRYLETKALPSAAILVFLAGGMVGVSIYLYYYATEIGYQWPERFFYVSAVFMFSSNLYTARYSDRMHALTLLLPCLAGGIVCNIALAFADGDAAGYLFPIAGAFYGFSLGIGFPMLNQIAVKASPPSRRGAASATFYLAMDVGVGGFSLLWGWALDAVSFRAAYSAAAFFIFVSLSLSIFFLGRKKHLLLR
jgi:MFS family permease